MIDRLVERPAVTAAILLSLAAFTMGCAFLGERAFREHWTGAAWVAWPGGASPFLIIGFVVWSVLLIPRARLDDHVFNHAGMDNPLGFNILFPIQDLLSGVALLVLGIALLGALVTLPGRIGRARRRG